MNISKFFITTGLCALILAPVPAFAKKIRIFTQKVNASTICGTQYSKYSCSTTKKHMRLRQADIALLLKNNEPDHLQVLGKIYTDLGATRLSLRPCGPVDENVFSANDMGQQSSPTSFVYKKRTDTRVDAALEADVKNVLAAAGVTGPALERLQADFRASYKRAAGREHNMTGSYYRVTLSDAVVTALQNPATQNRTARACSEYIRSTPGAALIYSMAVLKLDSASYASNVATDAAMNFAAKVQAKAPEANIAAVQAGVSTAVRTSLNTTLGTEYRVISWDYLTEKDFRI